MNLPFNDEVTDVAVDEVQPDPPRPTIAISVSDDKLAAWLTIEQYPPEPYQVTEEAIFEALAKAKVEYGVNLEAIEQIIANHDYPRELLIAQGQPARPGKDGRLEFLFARAASGSPVDLGYRVDFYDLNLVENVSAGQVLVRQIPAIMTERVKEAIIAEGWGEYIVNISSVFKTANSSSLDFEVICDFSGEGARYYRGFQRVLNSCFVETATENGWDIPFNTVTLKT